MKITAEKVGYDDIHQWEPKVAQALREGDAVIDCSSLRKADSALLALILKWIKEAQGRRLSPAIINLPEGMWSLAKLYGVRELIRPYCRKNESAQKP
ncbi:MAG TPA: STAS domain-containing protein [Candidatus Aphodousia gallistercoris]|nr:STAS domain-containing protein [Candidatus Aphodousia gallistercoris]